MPHTASAGPAIYYETSGDPGGEPIVLVSGAGAQLIWWRDGFVERLVARGCFVIRLDNRDVGRSDKLGGPSDVAAVYTIDDMADDVCRVLDALGLASVHIVGQSLGGAVAQAMAIASPERVCSMILFFTVPAFDAKWLTDEVQTTILGAAVPPSGRPRRAEAVATVVQRERLTSSTLYPFDDDWLREYAGMSFDRGYCPGGILRQVAASATSFGDRSEALAKIEIPTAIIHGRVDRLLKVEAGFELARLIRGSELHIYPGLGHEVVPALWGEFVDIIARTIVRASSARESAVRPECAVAPDASCGGSAVTPRP